MFPVKRLHHRLFVDAQYRAIRHGGCRPHADSLASKATFPEEITATQYPDGCFPPGFRDHRESYLARLDIEHCIAGVALGKDGLFLFKGQDFPAHSDGGEECVGIEFVHPLSCTWDHKRNPVALDIMP